MAQGARLLAPLLKAVVGCEGPLQPPLGNR